MAIGPHLLAAIGGQGGIAACGAPGTLSLDSATSSTIALTWSAPSELGGGIISGYRIKRNGSVLVADTSSTGTTYTATGLTASTSYSFTVAAINEAGAGTDGNTPSLSTTAAVLVYSTTGTVSTYDYTRSGTKVRSLKWTTSGTLTVTSMPVNTGMQWLHISGAGAGGGGSCAGGGGSGGASENTRHYDSTVDTYTCTVGAGGSGASTEYGQSTSGGDSAILHTNQTTAMQAGIEGGGYGGSSRNSGGISWNGDDGGSGGGGGAQSSAGGQGGSRHSPTYQGNDGGNAGTAYYWHQAGGGGGGRYSQGSDGSTNNKGAIGGTGTDYDYEVGAPIGYAGGGAGGGEGKEANTNAVADGAGAGGGSNNPAESGAANRGGGGGGGGRSWNGSGNSAFQGGDGGSGVIIVYFDYEW